MRPPEAKVGGLAEAVIPAVVCENGIELIKIRGDISPSVLTSIVKYSGWLKSSDEGNGVAEPNWTEKYPWSTAMDG